MLSGAFELSLLPELPEREEPVGHAAAREQHDPAVALADRVADQLPEQQEVLGRAALVDRDADPPRVRIARGTSRCSPCRRRSAGTGRRTRGSSSRRDPPPAAAISFASSGSPGMSYGIPAMPRGSSWLVKWPWRRSCAVTMCSNVDSQCVSNTITVSGCSRSMHSVFIRCRPGHERDLVAVVDLAAGLLRQHDRGDVRDERRADDLTHVSLLSSRDHGAVQTFFTSA